MALTAPEGPAIHPVLVQAGRFPTGRLAPGVYVLPTKELRYRAT